MRAMFLAFAAIIVIAFAANSMLTHAGFSTQERLSSDSVRLD